MNSEMQWVLVSQAGVEYALPQTMIFLGREECDVTLQSRSVDKRHAVITYDHYEKRFKVKDLNSANGTYVNDVRIPEQKYMKLEHTDTIRFGYDPTIYYIHCLQQPVGVSGGELVSPVTNLAYQTSWRDPVDHATPPSNNMADCHNRAANCKPSVVSTTNQSSHHQEMTVSSTTTSTGSFAVNATMVGADSSARVNLCGGKDDAMLSVPTNRLVGCNSEKEPNCTPAAHLCNNVDDHSFVQNQSCNAALLSQNPAVISGREGRAEIRPTALSSSSSSPSPAAPSPAAPSPPALHAADQERLSASEVLSVVAPGLASLRSKPESTSSNTSLHSAFSGDSLDQLVEGGEKQERSKSLPANKLDCSIANAANSSGKTAKNRSQVLCKGFTSEAVDVDVSPPGEANDSKLSPASSDKTTPRVAPTAFTIDFDDVKVSAKKFDIKDSISKFAPPKSDSERIGHRRNSSLSKVDEHKVLEILSDEHLDLERRMQLDMNKEEKVKGDQLSPELGSEKGYTVCSQKKVGNFRRGYHSEGYFSSDQDDDLSSKSELLGSKRTKIGDRGMSHSSGFGQQMKSPDRHKLKNKETSNRSVNSSAAFLINKMLNSAVKEQQPSPKHSASTPREKVTDFVPVITKQNVARLPSPPAVAPETVPRPTVLPVKSSIVEKPVKTSQSDKAGAGIVDDVKENVSESGTYTVDKESPNLELEEARRNIDRVFGITVEENEECDEPVIMGPRAPYMQDIRESQNSPDSELSKSKGESISKRSTPTWSREWSAISVHNNNKHSSSPDIEGQSSQTTIIAQKATSSTIVSGTNGLKLHFSESHQRPRRKLPTPPVDKLPFTLALSRSNDFVEDGMSSGSDRPTHKVLHVTTPTDGTFDTERHLRDTETLVSAMEARIDPCKSLVTTMGSSMESKDSGGESDVDTSTASYCNDKSHKQDKNIGKRLSSQLKAKLKLLDNSTQRSSSSKSARKPCLPPSNRGHGLTRTQSQEQEKILGSDNETGSVASDISSSSDVSGSPRPHRKRSDKLPPTMKLNRAFSLRRARLGYYSDGGNEKGKQVPPVQVSSHTDRSIQTTKKKSTDTKKPETSRSRPSSGGTVNLSRNDGGRFSLRMAKNVAGGNSGHAGRSDESVKSKQRLGSSSSTITGATRSNSTVSSKEMEMKNWKRRKEYDPMKAAAEGRKKEAAKKAATVEPLQLVPAIPTNSLQRSASFHGTEGLRIRRTTYTSEDDMVRSLEDEAVINARCQDDDDDYAMEIQEDEMHMHTSSKTLSVTDEEYPLESGFRTHSHADLAWNSTRSAQWNSSGRYKSKFEALDNLVITTIHQLSSKLCGHTETVLKKVKEQCRGDGEGPHSLEDLINSFGSPETPLSPNTRNTSRELAGTLKNLKKLEKGLEVIDALLLDAAANRSASASSKQKYNGLREDSFY